MFRYYRDFGKEHKPNVILVLQFSRSHELTVNRVTQVYREDPDDIPAFEIDSVWSQSGELLALVRTQYVRE